MYMYVCIICIAVSDLLLLFNSIVIGSVLYCSCIGEKLRASIEPLYKYYPSEFAL